jgi:hypothetical protein
MSALIKLGGNRKWVCTDGRLRYFGSAKAVVSFLTPLGHLEALQIIFSKRDGSIIVAPMFQGEPEGVVARLRRPAGAGSATMSYSERGRLTGQLVKYSHHLSGRAHFNLSGRTTSDVGKQSAPLQVEQLLFQFDAYWLAGLRLLQKPKQDRPYLPFAFEHIPTGLTIAARWWRKSSVVSSIDRPSGTTGPVTQVLNRKTGRIANTIFLGPPPGFPLQDWVLALECGEAKIPDGVTEPSVVLLGGLDHPDYPDEEAERGSSDALMLMYPSKADDDLRSRMGSIDLSPT